MSPLTMEELLSETILQRPASERKTTPELERRLAICRAHGFAEGIRPADCPHKSNQQHAAGLLGIAICRRHREEASQ